MKKLPILLFVFLSLILFEACQLGRYVVYNFADINDHKKFPSRPIKKDANEFNFSKSLHGKVPKELNIKGVNRPFEAYLKEHKTVAFIIIQNDTIQYENYWERYNESSIVPSFSVAKSITSILIGCAIEDQLIQSVNEPITNYIPELSKNGFGAVTIEHLLQMTS